MTEQLNRVFVYGTLKVGGFFAQGFNDDRKEVVPATVRATLYGDRDYRGYPMLKEGTNVVHGELHTYDNIEDVIQRMDIIEGYSPDDNPEHCLFIRKEVKALVSDKDAKNQSNGYDALFDAWAYFFNLAIPGGAIELTDGVWQMREVLIRVYGK